MTHVSVEPRWMLLLVGSLLAGACRPPTTPVAPFGGTFVLRSVDSQPLPVLEWTAAAVREYLIADTVTFDGRGHVAAITVTRIDSVGGPYSVTQKSVSTRDYAVRGDTIDFPIFCPANTLCARPPVGWRLPDGSLVIAFRLLTLQYPARYGFVKHYESLQ